MRRDNTNHPGKAKRVARQMFAKRKIDKWIDWSWKQRGKVTYKDLINIQNKYNIQCYGWTRK